MSEQTPIPFLNASEMSEYSVSRNHTNFKNLFLEQIETHGFSIITELLSQEDIQSAQRALGLDLLEAMDGPACAQHAEESVRTAHTLITSANIEDIPRLWPGQYLVPNSHGFPQGRFAWETRLHPRVREVFELLFEGEGELCVGMDQLFYRPSHFSYEFGENYGHGHTDHNFHDLTIADTSKWRIFQSILSIWPSIDRGDWGTLIWPGSHKKIHPCLMADRACQRPGHFAHILSMSDPDEKRRVQAGYRAESRRVQLPAGSLLVWDSRTIHQGCRTGKRLAMPICWEPKSRRPEGARRRKLLVAASGNFTTHWASLANKASLHWGTSPRTNGHYDKAQDLAVPACGAEDVGMVELARTARGVRPLPVLASVALDVCEGSEVGEGGAKSEGGGAEIEATESIADNGGGAQLRALCASLLERLDAVERGIWDDSAYATVVSDQEAEQLEKFLKQKFLQVL